MEKHASVRLMVPNGRGGLIIARGEAREWTPREIIREFDRRVIWQHAAARALGGTMHPTNLWPTLRAIDRIETPRDISAIAKSKRLAREQRAFVARLLSKHGQARQIPVDVRGHLADTPAPAKRPWGSRPFPKRKAAWPKRSFPKRKGRPER